MRVKDLRSALNRFTDDAKISIGGYEIHGIKGQTASHNIHLDTDLSTTKEEQDTKISELEESLRDLRDLVKGDKSTTIGELQQKVLSVVNESLAA